MLRLPVNSSIRKSEFARNAITLTLGTSVAQIIPILFYPVLSRIFLPSDFGLLATITSITSILTVLSTGKYESCILIASSKQNAANVIGLVLSLGLPFLTISYLVLQTFSVNLGNWLSQPDLYKWIFICPISALSIVIFSCYNEWCVRNKYFVSLAWNKIINSTAISVSKLLLGIIHVFSNGLVFGDLIGRMISATGCIIRAIFKDKPEFMKISLSQMKIIAIRYHEFPKLYLPAQLLNTVGVSFPVFLIGAYFNSNEVGFYAMTMSVLSMPLTIISSSIRDTFRQRANEEIVKKGNCRETYIRLLKILTIAGFSGCAIIIYFMPDLFSFFLGEKWRTAGEYSQILLPMMTIDFVAMSLSGILIIREKLGISLLWQLYYVFITLISLIAGFLLFADIRSTLICFSIGRGSAYLLQIIISNRYSKGKAQNV